MKRVLLTSIAALPLLLIQPTQSHAQFVVACANCSSLAQQAVEVAKQAQQYLTQLQSYQTQLQQYQNMLQNTVALPQSIWSNVTGEIMQVRNLANAASLLTGNSGTILTRLQSAQGYAGQSSVLPQNVGAQFIQWQQTLGNASNSLGRTLGVQQGQEQNIAALQMAIQAQSQSATGQMQAIQAGNQLAALTSTQLNQIQTTLTAYAYQQASRDDVAADRQAMQDAQLQQFISAPYLPVSGGQGY